MAERRTCSRVKPWIYFLMELTIFVTLGAMIVAYVDSNLGFPIALIFVAALIYKTRSFQRLEKVLERTRAVRKSKIQEKYGDDI